MKNEMLAVIRLLEQMESNLQQRGGRGYGASHPYVRGYRRVYGKSDYSVDDEEEHGEVTQRPVKISRAFKKGR